MAVMEITSKKLGKFQVLLDDEDFEKVKKLGGKWCVVKRANRNGFYVEKRINGKIVLLWRYILNAKKGQYVDHINRNTLDNRRCNLRLCSNGANIRNGKVRTNNTSGVTGVSLYKCCKTPKWEAYIKVNYRKIHLGIFDSKEEAIKARKEAEIRYFDQ